MVTEESLCGVNLGFGLLVTLTFPPLIAVELIDKESVILCV